MTTIGSRVGYDTLELHQGLLLDLQFREGAGAVTHDYAKPHHPMTLVSAPAWSDIGLTFAGDPDEITCPGASTADLDFTSEDFSLVVWAYSTNLGSANVYMNRATLDTCGWEWYTANNNLALRTNQAGSREGASGMGCVVLNTWQCLGMSRDGLIGQAYANGRPVYTLHTTAGLLDPVACGAHTFRVANNPHDNGFRGTLWRPRIWDRLLTAGEFAHIFEMERHIFGV